MAPTSQESTIRPRELPGASLAPSRALEGQARRSLSVEPPALLLLPTVRKLHHLRPGEWVLHRHPRADRIHIHSGRRARNSEWSQWTGVNFTAQATALTWSISGSITPGSLGAGTLVTATGPVTASAVADANGNYAITQLPSGTYTVTPGKAGYGSTPPASPSP